MLNTEIQETLNSKAKAESRMRSNPDYTAARQTHFREKTRRPLPAEIVYGSTTFRIGDKVIQTRNNYDKNIFNGEPASSAPSTQTSQDSPSILQGWAPNIRRASST